MTAPLFELFSEMIDCLPSNRILPAIDLAHNRLEEDILYKRIPESTEADSILTFCQFVEAVTAGDAFSRVHLPISHVVFYEKIVWRLIAAGAIARSAKKEFDACFSEVHLNDVSGWETQPTAGSNWIPRLSAMNCATPLMPAGA